MENITVHLGRAPVALPLPHSGLVPGPPKPALSAIYFQQAVTGPLSSCRKQSPLSSLFGRLWKVRDGMFLYFERLYEVCSREWRRQSQVRLCVSIYETMQECGDVLEDCLQEYGCGFNFLIHLCSCFLFISNIFILPLSGSKGLRYKQNSYNPTIQQ